MSSSCQHGRPAIDPEIQRKIYSEIDTLVRTMEHWTADANSLTTTAQDFFAKAYVLLSINTPSRNAHHTNILDDHHPNHNNHQQHNHHNHHPQHHSPARRCDMLLKLLIATGIDATIELENTGGKGRPCHRVAVLAILIAEFETFVRTRREFHADRTRRYGDFAQICEYFAIRSTCPCQQTLWQWSLNSNNNNTNSTHNNPSNTNASANAAATGIIDTRRISG